MCFNPNFSDNNSRCVNDLALKYKTHTGIHFTIFTNTYYFDITTIHSYFSRVYLATFPCTML